MSATPRTNAAIAAVGYDGDHTGMGIHWDLCRSLEDELSEMTKRTESAEGRLAAVEPLLALVRNRLERLTAKNPGISEELNLRLFAEQVAGAGSKDVLLEALQGTA